MKLRKSYVAVAAMLSASAFAQSNVTIGGRVDLGYSQLTHDSAGAQQSQESASRIFFAGNEDLGSGLSAFFKLEERFDISNGTSAARWAGESNVGLKSNALGTLTLGRLYSVIDSTIDSNLYEANGGDTIAGTARYGTKANSRWNNAAYYTTPNFGPVSFSTAMNLSEAAGVKNQYGLSANFKQGPLKMALAYQRDVTPDTTLNSTSAAGQNPWKTWVLAANYDFGPLQWFGTAGRSKGYDSGVTGGYNLEGAKETFVTTGLIVPAGPGAVHAQYAHYQDTNVAGEKQAAVNQFGLGYWYNLSKRTTVQLNTVYKKQRGGFDGSSVDAATNTLTAGSANNQAGVQVALRHDF